MKKLIFWDKVIGKVIKIDGKDFEIIEFRHWDKNKGGLGSHVNIYLDEYHMDTFFKSITNREYEEYGVSKHAHAGALLVKEV